MERRQIFGLFRLAVIAQQIYYRYYHGQTRDKRFGMLIAAVQVLEAAGHRVELCEQHEELERRLAAVTRNARAPSDSIRYRLMGRRGPLRVRAFVRVR